MTIYFVNEENPSQVYTERNIECDEKPESLYKVYKEIEEVLREIVVETSGAVDAFIVGNKKGVLDNRIVVYRLIGWGVNY